MEIKLQDLVNQVGTDVSGKWMAVDRIDQLANLIVQECANFLKDKMDDHFAAEQLEEHFGIK
jgi:hypothetical protein